MVAVSRAVRLRAALPLAAAAAAVVATALPGHAFTPGGGYAASFVVTPGPDDPGPTPACGAPAADRGADWADLEEQHSGTSAWRDGTRPGRVTGWLDATTAVCGQTLGIHLSGSGAAVVTAYRVGWYHGAGAREVWHSGVVRIARHGYPEPSPTGMVETDWPAALDVTPGPTWTPGLYLLVARPAGQPHAYGAAMPLVVRRPGPDGAHVLAVASTLTWQAYDRAGGRSLYVGPDDTYPTRARVVSFDRPYLSTGLAHVFAYDAPLARFLGRVRADADWTTDDDVDRAPNQLLDHRAVVFPGHSEYWTSRMYDGAEAARNQGVNLAFLGANPVYWQGRLDPDATGAPRRRLSVYRSLTEDPDAADRPLETTIRWQDYPLLRDEAQLVGLTYATAGVRGGYLVVDPPAWLVAGTGLGQGRGLPDAAANEVDSQDGVRTGAAAPDVQTVLEGSWADRTGRTGTFAATYYTTPGGAGVFAAGTTAWDCDLDQSCPFGNRVSAATAAAMRRMTENLLTAFTTPGFTVVHASHASVRHLSASAFRARLARGLRATRAPRTRGGLDDD